MPVRSESVHSWNRAKHGSSHAVIFPVEVRARLHVKAQLPGDRSRNRLLSSGRYVSVSLRAQLGNTVCRIAQWQEGLPHRVPGGEDRAGWCPLSVASQSGCVQPAAHCPPG